ncbi:uncharacterized protein LOC128741001 [Sabethes cyaneus]|uniref:uncharacterized protein LOC128741001 n=1 Tax=Sabethes cyaneus TaxID=53552 RepID=UPI00237D8EE8|nr:uncharacterized protein LOC128741001 [Sabethes cyaneus]
MLPVPNYTSTNIPAAVLNAALIPGKLNICHGNAQSLCARQSSKLDEVRNVLVNSKIEVACFTESWLTSKISDRSIGISGYTVVRNDRSYRRGGGIAVYYRSQLKCSKIFGTVLSSDSTDLTECLALDFRLYGEKILLMVIYNPPDNDCSSFLAEKLTEFAVRYEHIFIVEDFNTDMLRSSARRVTFESILSNFSLTSVGEEPTFFHNEGSSQLDLFITSNNDKVIRFNQVSFPGLSQHDLIFASTDFNVTQSTHGNTYRDYVNFDSQSLENAILSIAWNYFYENENPDECLEFFNRHIKAVHDCCIPLRTRARRWKSNAWFNGNVRRCLLERDLAYKDWLRATPQLKAIKRQQYKVLRNRANAEVARAKKEYLKRYLDSRTSSKCLWQRVRSLGVGKAQTALPSDFDPDEVNNVFLSNYTGSATVEESFSNATFPSPYNFSFRPVYWWEVTNAIWEITSHAVGLDGLPIKFIKIILPLVIQHITHQPPHCILYFPELLEASKDFAIEEESTT